MAPKIRKSRPPPLNLSPHCRSPARLGPIDVTYVFVWSLVTAETLHHNEGDSSMRILSASDEPEPDGVFICTAAFKWRAFEADFTCLWDPASDAFLEFEMTEESAGGGMEEVESVEVGESGVVDERGNEFLRVDFEFGGDCGGPLIGTVYGKRALPGENLGGVKLSEAERLELEIEDEDWEEAE